MESTQTQGPQGRRQALPGLPWAIGVAVVGAAIAAGILWYRDPAKPMGDALAPAAQVLLAAVVAAFGITQILIAQAAARAAEDAVKSTDDQTTVMREQLAQARDEAAASAMRTDSALDLASMGHMDGDAPVVALTYDDLTFVEPGKDRYNFNMETGDLTLLPSLELTESEARERVFRYTGVATLSNFGHKPVHWAKSGTHDPSEPHGGLQGLVMPGKSHQFYVDETRSVAEWADHLESQQTAAGLSFHQVQVTVYGSRNLVMDTLTLGSAPPRIKRNGDRYVVESPLVPHALAADVQRTYNRPAMSEPGQDTAPANI